MIQWGILGAGNIVDRWIKGAMQCPDTRIAAIASRDGGHAREKAQRYGIPRAMTYEALVEDPEIQVVYVAVPHTAHAELAMLAMEHGKSVLVEKPAAVNAAQLRQMMACARKNGVFLMEAVWTRFLPLTRLLLEELERGSIGDVRDLQVSFSFRAPAEPKSRLMNPELAGGGLLDTGVYNLHFADLVFGRAPECLIGLATMDSDEHHIPVDEQACYIARYENGALATMTSGVRTDMLDTALIYGTEGYLEIPRFWCPQSMKLTRYPEAAGGSPEIREFSAPTAQRVPGLPDEGYQYEILHVNECVRAGLPESPVMPLEKSLEILTQCDTLRRQWGLVYPFEKSFLPE